MINLVPLTLSDAFPGVRISNHIDELRSRLGQLSCTETLRYCSYLNQFVSDPVNPQYGLTQQSPLVEQLFTDGAIRNINRTAEKYSPHLQLTVFHRRQLLELMCWASLYCPDSAKHASPVKNNQSKRLFAQAALIASDLVSEPSDHRDLFNGNREFVRKHLLKLVRLYAQGASQVIAPERAFGRGKMMFFDYLPQEFPDFEVEFRIHSGGLSLNEY